MIYLNPIDVGLDAVNHLEDGTSFNISWFKAYPSNSLNKIGYNIYFSTVKENVFFEGAKYVSITSDLTANIIDMDPGQEYWFSVRPFEYSPTDFDPTILPVAYDDLRYYPASMLVQNMSDTQLFVPLIDVDGFPASGIIKIGAEIIKYSSVDVLANNLLLSNISQRGFRSTTARNHDISGFDGYHTYNMSVSFFTSGESDMFDRIFASQARFEYPHFPYTPLDGYKQVLKDLLNTDLSVSDEFNEPFPSYNYSGWHRTDPKLIINGTCVGSYIGGERGCIDGYGNFGRIRGLNLQEVNNQRQEQALEIIGKPAVLLRRQMVGIRCACFLANSEYPDDRCPKCRGTGFVSRYEQFFNPRRSDGRILVRPDPTNESLKMQEAGLESTYDLKLWTLTTPTIKSRDVIIMFDQAGNEEFRYEVMSVDRNSTTLGLQGAQKLNLSRVRKFDPIYQETAFRDTSLMPEWMDTSIASAIPAVMPHKHQIRKNEDAPNTWSQTTQVSAGHVHSIIVNSSGQLEVQETLGHTHTLI